MPQRPPSRREQQAARRARIEKLRAERARKSRRQAWLVIGGSIVAAVLVLGLVALTLHDRGGSGSATKDESVSPAALTGKAIKASVGKIDTSQKSSITGVTFYAGLANNHVTTPVTYAPIPPVGGQHNPVWLNCGIYNDPVPNEYAVHDLEHGAVWITYQPGLDTASVDALIKVAKDAGSYVTLSPYTGLTNKVVVSGWGVQLKLDSATDPRLKQFVSTYRLSPKVPEPHGECTGGIGQPRGTVVVSPSTTPSAGATASSDALSSVPATVTATAAAPTGSTTP